MEVKLINGQWTTCGLAWQFAKNNFSKSTIFSAIVNILKKYFAKLIVSSPIFSLNHTHNRLTFAVRSLKLTHFETLSPDNEKWMKWKVQLKEENVGASNVPSPTIPVVWIFSRLLNPKIETRKKKKKSYVVLCEEYSTWWKRIARDRPLVILFYNVYFLILSRAFTSCLERESWFNIECCKSPF